MPIVDASAKIARITAVLPEVRGMAQSCNLCGRRCGVDRLSAASGHCRAAAADGDHARWQTAVLHFGEEPMLVGRGGSGTVFFSHCNLRCAFCQNWRISHEGEGKEGHFRVLAEAFLDLEAQGAENINLVTATHYIYPVLQALREAYEKGLHLPVVYNTNGYDAEALVHLLDGIVDVWLPDLKYMDAEPAKAYSQAADYPEVARAAIRAMFRQVGGLEMEGEVARRGLIIRHLVLPENASGSYDFLLWLLDEGMTDIPISLMSQYTPQFRAAEYAPIARPLRPEEYEAVVDFADRLGFTHLLVQAMESQAHYLPDFDQDQPFERA